MKQIFWELWIENKKIPILLGIKIILIALSILSGILLRGYPYSILILFITMTLQCTTPKFFGQVEYLIPLENEKRNKNHILKSALVAGIYAIANAVGYGLTISLIKQYEWDGEMIVFMSVMTVFPFILIFNFRLLFERIRYFKIDYIIRNKRLERKVNTVGIELLIQGLALLCVFLFLLYKLARIDVVMFLGTGYWRILSVVVIGVEFVLLCVSTWMRCTRVETQDYCQ